MKQNRKWILILSIVLSVAIAAGGTMAYLQDTDEDVNVMTLGNVYINQLEYERVPTEGHELTNDAWVSTGETDKYGYTPDEVQPFTQAKPLYPAVFDDGIIKWDERVGNNGDPHQQSWADVKGEKTTGAPGSFQLFDNSVKNVIDKFVFVENTGNSDAYVRTWIALEQGSVEADNFKNVIMTNTDKDHWDWETVATNVEIKDTNNVTGTYYVLLATYKGPTSNPTGILAPGAISYVSLAQVYMKPEATNDDVIAIDGNQNGTYDILVFSQAVQAEGFTDAKTALNEAFGGVENIDLTDENNPIPWKLTKLGDNRPNFEAALNDTDHWDGTVDTSWYNDTDTEFVLTTAEQLAGFGKLVDEGNTFDGKTVKLGNNICLGCTTGECANEDGNPIFFDPIGDASNADFSGTFDGQNKTIYNLRQDCNSKHLGLFGAVYEGTVKNLVLDGARIENNGNGYAAAVASYTGASTFENITLRNTTVANYNHNTAGIAAWVSNNGTTTTFDGIKIEDTTTIASWWGSPDTRVGGIVGAMNTGNYVVIKNSTVACRLDVYNDVTSNYQWGNYRMAGMVVGDVRDYHTVDGRTEANPARVTCENVTVVFGDWANYHYCESASYGTPSYADEGEHKFHRVESGEGYGGVETSACNHNADETHNELIAFDFLFGARDGKGIYGISAFDGVTVVK